MKPYEPPPKVPLGATVPDLILRVFSSRFLVIPIFLIMAGFVLMIALGFIDVSWSDGGLKVSHGERNAQTADVNIAGHWRAMGKDLTDSDHKLTAKYSYTMSMSFVQKGTDVKMQGSYTINEDSSLPERFISGHGVIHGDYLSLLYDIEAGHPAIAKTHGEMLIKIEPSANRAEGYYLTRSMANDGIVFGSIELTR